MTLKKGISWTNTSVKALAKGAIPSVHSKWPSEVSC